MSSEPPSGQGLAAAGAGPGKTKKQRFDQPSGSDEDPGLSPGSGDDAAEMDTEQAPAATATVFDAISAVAAAATAPTAPVGSGGNGPPRRKIIIPRASPATASRGSSEGRAALEGGVAALLAAADGSSGGQGPSGLDLAAGGRRRGRADVASPGAAVPL